MMLETATEDCGYDCLYKNHRPNTEFTYTRRAKIAFFSVCLRTNDSGNFHT